jgi:two-component system sensor histidine kinase ChvG
VNQRSLRARAARRLLSLRGRTMLAVVAMALAPLAFVWLSDVGDRTTGARMRVNVAAAADEVAASLEAGLDAEALASAAPTHEVWLRVVDERGVVLLDDNEEADNWTETVGEVFFGPDGAPTLAAWDASLPPLPTRPEVRAAAGGASVVDCAAAPAGGLLVCHAARSVVGADGARRTVYVSESSRRAIRALYDVRYQILKLTMFSGVFGVLMGWWVSKRMVRPIEDLREAVLARAQGPNRLSPVMMARDDEIGDLALAFDALIARLAARDRAYEAFVADLAHELKNPVAAVRACAESMGRAGALDDARTTRIARVLDDSSRRLDVLVTRFLDLARAEAGLRDDERARIDVGALVEGLVGVLREDERFAGVSFETTVAGGLPTVLGVSERLETVLRNLLENAASFAGRPGRVVVTVHHDDGDVVLEVADSGPGIPPEDVERVFERFFTTRSDSRGTGLGLALAQAIVLAHHGTLVAASPEGGGAVFTVRLPAG